MSNKYTYMILCGHIFTWGGGRFHNVFVDRPTKWDIGKQNKTSKHLPTINYYGSQEDMIINGI
jgi:hypothetical protein